MGPLFGKIRKAHCIASFVSSASSFNLAPVWKPNHKMPTAVVDNSLSMTSGNSNRAHFVRTCAAASVGAAAALTLAPRSSSATTASHVVNSVLSAYGIPMMTELGDFTSVYVQLPDEAGQRTLCAFSYPKYWVEAQKKNGLISAANYQTGDGLLLNVGEAKGKSASIWDFDAIAIAAESTPSQGAVKVLHDEAVEKGGVKYKYLTVKYNTVTRSGYDVERIAYIAATIKRKKLFTLVSTVSGERRYKMETNLDAIRASFRVGDVSTSTPPPSIDT